MVSEEEEEWDRTSSHLEPWIRSIFHGLRILYRNAMRRIINSEHHRSSHARSSLASDRESGNEQGCRTWQGYEPSKDANSDRSSSLTGLINTSPLPYSNFETFTKLFDALPILPLNNNPANETLSNG